ncbi:MAG: NYN domain-containing protein [Rhodobacteraceae bacterium]|nr:NYN domain-containing protein [Paracoccaceae bacterium]
MNGRVAIFVDGDNINPDHADRIRAIGKGEGQLDFIRVYADATRNTDWQSAPGFRLIHAGTGKNAADLLLSVQAMELALTNGHGTLVIASSDGDFTHLATRLRELGRRVVGLGESKAPTRFRAACTEFTELAAVAKAPVRIVAPKPEQAATTPAPATAQNGTTITELDRNIRNTIASHSHNGKGMRIADLSPKMNAQFGVRISTYPDGNWRAYFNARKDLYDLDPRGPDAHVRYKPKGFAI